MIARLWCIVLHSWSNWTVPFEEDRVRCLDSNSYLRKFYSDRVRVQRRSCGRCGKQEERQVALLFRVPLSDAQVTKMANRSAR